MAEPDTIKLLQECNAGVKMGIASMGDVLMYIHAEDLRRCLADGVSNAAIADFVTDGCNIGVKSLNKYLNRCQAADETSKDLAKRLIGIAAFSFFAGGAGRTRCHFADVQRIYQAGLSHQKWIR